MGKITLKILGTIIALLTIVFLSFTISINKIGNLTITKELVKLISSHIIGTEISYDKVQIDIFRNKELIINNFTFNNNDVSGKIETINAKLINKTVNLKICNGAVNIKVIRPSKEEKKLPENITTPFKEISIENIRINIKTTNVNIDKLKLEENRHFVIEASIDNTTNVTASGTYQNSIVKSKIAKLVIVTDTVNKLLRNINVKPPQIKLFKNNSKLEARNLEITANTAKNDYLIKVTSLWINNKNFIANNNSSSIIGEITLRILPQNLIISAENTNADLENVYELIDHIETIKTVYEIKHIAHKGNLEIEKLNVTIPLDNRNFDVKKDIEIISVVKDGSVKIPQTRLEALLDGRVTLEDGILRLNIESSNVEGIKATGNFTIIVSNPNTPYYVNLDFSGDAANVNSIIEKIPNIKDISKKITLKDGIINGWLNITQDKTFNADIKIASDFLAASIDEIGDNVNLFGLTFNLENSTVKMKIQKATMYSTNIEDSEIIVDLNKNMVLIRSETANLNIEKIKKEKFFNKIKDKIENLVGIFNGIIRAKNVELIMENNSIKNVTAHGDIIKAHLYIKKHNIDLTDIDTNFNINYPETVKIHSGKLLIDAKVPLHIKHTSYEIPNNKVVASLDTVYNRDLEKFIERFVDYKPITPKDNDVIYINISVDTNKLALNGDIDVIGHGKRVSFKNIEAKDNKISGDIFISCKDKDGISGKISYTKFDNLLKGNLKGKISLECIKECFHTNIEHPKFKDVELNTLFTISLSKPEKTTVQGTVVINELALDGNKIDFSAEANRDSVEITSLFIETPYGSSGGFGKIERKEEKIIADLFLQGRAIDIDAIIAKFGETPKKQETAKLHSKFPISLKVDFDFSNARLIKKDFKNLKGNLKFDSEGETPLEIKTYDVDLCGIRLNAYYAERDNTKKLKVEGQGNGDLDYTLKCLTGNKEKIITGTFGYIINVDLEGQDLASFENAKGELQFVSEDGRIHRLTIVSKILEILNLYKLITFKFSEFAKEGFSYNYSILYAKIKNNKITIKDSYIDSDALKMWAEGTINIKQNNIKMLVLAAPFSTIDKILSRIPVIGPVFLGKSKTLLSIPFKVTGSIDSPEVTPLDPGSIGKGILNLIKRIIRAPLYIFPTEEN